MTRAEKIRTLLKANETESALEIKTLVSSLARARVASITEAASIRETAQQLSDFKKAASENIPAMEADILAIQQFDTTILDTLIAKAVVDWPEKKQTLEARMKAYADLKAKSLEAWDSTADARQKVVQNDFAGVDFDNLMTAASVLSNSKQGLQAAPSSMEALIDQLYWSWDKILADLEINEGQVVTFRQKFETTKVRALVPEGQTVDPPTPVTEWKTVNKATHDKMSKSLGMVVEHKPAGKFDNESVKTVQPPGYSYIAPESQGRNRYGYWDRRSDGNSFWVFYGQYSFMRSMFWGPSFGHITPYYYNDYRTHYDSGRTYYGRNKYGKPMYGSEGSLTKSNYASSKYVATNGYKNSQYVKSGGKFRGSKYQRSSSSNKYSSSSKRSSSRSYSSRSSGFRSSGGFGGK